MAARVAYPTGGNPVTASCLIDFELVDSAGAGTPETLLGWSATETTGSATASFRLHDGSNDSSPALASEVKLAEDGRSMVDFDEGIEVNSGQVFLEVVSGSVEVVIFW